MKVAFATVWDSRNVLAWSGTGYYMAAALRAGGFEVERIGPLREARRPFYRLEARLRRFLTRRAFESDGLPAVCDAYARQVERALPQLEPDLVVSPNSSLVARLRTDVPVVLWIDATFAGLVSLPDTGLPLCRRSIAAGHRMQREALANCSLALFSSEWAAQTARRDYGVDPEKVRVVPFGANLEPDLDRMDIEAVVAAREGDRCKLLFVGVDWRRKGGDLALETARRLRRAGLETELSVVGCEPPGPTPRWVRRHGFLCKRTAKGRRRMARLFRESHFLLLPTRSDCCPMVFAEASAHALPSVGTDVGGAASAVRNGRNGQLFAPHLGAEAYARYILEVLSEEGRYRSLALSSHDEYAARLNWPRAGRLFRRAVDEVCGTRRAARVGAAQSRTDAS